MWNPLKSEPVLAVLGRLAAVAGIEPKNRVFIVGTGRCGTSLFSRILESHRHVGVFPNEANHLWHPALYPVQRLDGSILDVSPIEIDPAAFTRISLQQWPETHASRLERNFRGAYFATGMRDAFVVKSAMISFMMPKIIELFPNAKFLHLYRSGPSVVESLVKKNFGRYARFEYSEPDYRLFCAKYWNSCLLEIDKVRRGLLNSDDGRIFEFSYEALCADPSTMLKKIAGFMGVRPEDFQYDLSSITSANWKVGEPAADEHWQQMLQAMRPAMELKGYR